MSSFGDPSYGITRRLPGANFADVVEQVRARLGEQGFGVLTEIDVKATMKKKLDLDYEDYLILGACAPPFAHKALSLERSIGLLLPCNVVVASEDGAVVVSAIKPSAMFQVLEGVDIEEVAQEVGTRLTAALDGLTA